MTKRKSKRYRSRPEIGRCGFREKMIGQTIGYRYDVKLLPDYDRLTPFLAKYMEFMGWKDRTG